MAELPKDRDELRDVIVTAVERVLDELERERPERPRRRRSPPPTLQANERDVAFARRALRRGDPARRAG